MLKLNENSELYLPTLYALFIIVLLSVINKSV